MAKPLSCFLVTYHTATETVRKVINELSFSIGRAQECAVSFSDLNVSRHHLLVKSKGGKVWIEDQGSANGTFVNDTKIEAKRLMLIEPTNKIKLGVNGPEVFIETVERVFSEQEVEESTLKQEDKEAVLNLITGAHAEAARIVAGGKETHDKLVRHAEEKVSQLDKQLKEHREKIMSDAHRAAQEIVDSAKAQADVLLEDARRIASEDAMRSAKAEAALFLEEARATAVRTVDEAKHAAGGHLEKAREEAERYVREHKEMSERDADAYFSKRHQEIEQYSIQKSAEVDEYRVEQEKSSREMMTHEIENYIKEKRDLEALVIESRAQLSKILPELKSVREEHGKIESHTRELRAETERLKSDKAELLALESKRADLAGQVTKLEKQAADHEREHGARVAENQSAFEKESSKRKSALEDELTGLRLAEMERLRRERAAALETISRERERLGQKILVEVQSAAVSSIPVENWRAVAANVESAIQENLKIHALSVGSDENLTPLISQMSASRKRTRLVYTLQGFFAAFLVLAIGWRVTQQMTQDADPVKSAAEEESRRIKEDLERRKFNPPQDDEVRATYADAVIYTRSFVQNYQSADFQKEWLKKASSYFLKKWKVQEESIVQVLSATSTLVATLAERKEAIHPDHVQEALKKMNELEEETLTKVKDILGSEVRLEAFKRLEKKTYNDFYSGRAPAQDEPAQ